MVQVDRLGPKVGGHLAPCCTHRVNQGELSQCCSKHDDSTVNIVPVLLIIIEKKTLVYHTVNGDHALFHTSKTAKMIKVILLRAP